MRALATRLFFLGLLVCAVLGTSLEKCFAKVQNLTAEQPPTSPQGIALSRYSGHDQNELGNYDKCNETPDMHYTLLAVAVAPQYNIFLGACVPSICDAQAMGQA